MNRFHPLLESRKSSSFHGDKVKIVLRRRCSFLKYPLPCVISTVISNTDSDLAPTTESSQIIRIIITLVVLVVKVAVGAIPRTPPALPIAAAATAATATVTATTTTSTFI